MDALNLIKIPEDRQFLLAQKEKGRRVHLGPLDKALSLKESRNSEHHEGNISKKRHMDPEMVTLHKSGDLNLSSNSRTSVDSANGKDAYLEENSSDLLKKEGKA